MKYNPKAFEIAPPKTPKTPKAKAVSMQSAVSTVAFPKGGAKKPRPKISSKGRFRPLKTELTEADAMALYVSHKPFAQFINAMVIQDNANEIKAYYVSNMGGAGALKNANLSDAKDFSANKSALFSTLTAMAQSAAQKNTVAGWVKTQANALRDLANKAKIHPMDAVEFLQSAVVNKGGLFNAAQMLKSGNLNRSISIFRSITANRAVLASAKSSTLREVAKSLNTLQGQPTTGFSAISGMNPWTAGGPVSSAMAVEVVGMEYEVAKDFGVDGKPTGAVPANHPASAYLAQQYATTLGEYLETVRRLPVGRMWLCMTSKGKGRVFIGFDHAPKGKVFVTEEKHPLIAALNGYAGETKLVGFIS